MSLRSVRLVAGALLTASALAAVVALAPPQSVALAQDDAEGSAADLIDDARGELAIARGWVSRADDPDLEFGQRRAARIEAVKLLKDVCAKFGAALEKEPGREASIASDLKDARSMLSRMRKMSGIGEASGAQTETAGAPPPPAERPPTVRAEPPPPKPDEPKPPAAPLAILAWDDWDKTFRDVAGGDGTTVGKLDALRAAVAGKAIEFRGKIEDVVPTDAAAPGVVTVKLCGIYGGAPKRSFVVQAADSTAVAAWRRWDRVSWREVVTIPSLEKIEYRPIYAGPADLVRTANPGPVYPRPVKAVLRVTGYQTWLVSYVTEYALKRQWARATRSLRAVSQKQYAIPAQVVEVDGTRAHVKLGERLVAKMRGQPRQWGPVDDDVWLDVTDPQILEGLKAPRAIEVYGDITYPLSVADVGKRDGQFDMSFSFGKLR